MLFHGEDATFHIEDATRTQLPSCSVSRVSLEELNE